jgi:hypothetical protein
MLHCAGTSVFGARSTVETDGLEDSTYDMLLIVDDVFIQMLLEKTTMGTKDVHNWMYFDDFNFMTAEEAYTLNLATVLKGT